MGDRRLVVRQLPKPPLKPYILWGPIVANLLPHMLDLGKIRIVKESGERLASLSRGRPTMPRLSMQGGDAFASGTPADLTAKSNHLIWVRVDAHSEDEAYYKAVEHRLPPVVATLAAQTGGPVLVDLVRVALEDEFGNTAPAISPFSPSASIRGFEISPMDSLAKELFRTRVSFTSRDDVARSAARDFAEASRMSFTTGGVAANLQAALLRYFSL